MGLGSLIPRPSHCPVFDHLQYAKTRGKLGPFYHMNDVGVYSARQRGRGGVLLRPCGRGTGIQGYPTVILAHSQLLQMELVQDDIQLSSKLTTSLKRITETLIISPQVRV